MTEITGLAWGEDRLEKYVEFRRSMEEAALEASQPFPGCNLDEPLDRMILLDYLLSEVFRHLTMIESYLTSQE